jgi:hypothetical protein
MMKIVFAFLLAVALVYAQCDADAANAIAECAETYNDCLTDAGTDIDAICECYTDYGSCGACGGPDCYTEDQIDALIDSCDTIGCDGCDDFWTCSDGDGDGVAAVAASAALVAGALAF